MVTKFPHADVETNADLLGQLAEAVTSLERLLLGEVQKSRAERAAELGLHVVREDGESDG